MLGFLPHNIKLYQQAFKHKSVILDAKNLITESNERLEFLGDAVLEIVISEFLFIKYPFKDEGFLTQLRSKLVSRKQLNFIAHKIGLQELLQSNVAKESKSIYGDAIEALIGAIFIDKGFRVVKQFIIEKIINIHIDIEEVMQTETDFKSRVIEWCQKNKQPIDFKITESEINNEKIYEATLLIDNLNKGIGKAFTKKKAEQIAAEQFYNTQNDL